MRNIINIHNIHFQSTKITQYARECGLHKNKDQEII